MKRIIIILTLLLFLTGCANNIEDGVSYLENGKYEEAIATFQKDIKKKKNLDEAYRGQGIAYFELGNYEKAVSSFKLALDNEAKDTATIYSFLGACYMELEEYDLALDSYEHALAKQDLNTEMKQEIQFNLIAVYEKMCNWDAAKKQMETYVELYPDDSRVEKEAEFLETR